MLSKLSDGRCSWLSCVARGKAVGNEIAKPLSGLGLLVVSDEISQVFARVAIVAGSHSFVDVLAQ